ncbi:MAG: DUF3877 family protein [Ruminococcus sp.]|nr:DUF3877 family protein [Ruminococcus sp.]
MNLGRLEQNLIDNIREAQLKLGYEPRPVSLNYMYSSLSHLLGCEVTPEKSAEFTAVFRNYSSPRLGELTFRNISGGVCVTVPAQGVSYVHDLASENNFLAELISLAVRHGATLDDAFALFRKYSDRVHIEDKSSGGEFDYLVYFEDGQPDDYRYCISAEDDFGCCHISYHRFIPEDYEDLGF